MKAGVTLSTTLFNFTYLIVYFLRMGTTGVTAQAVGRDDREEMLRVVLRNGLIAMGIGGLLLLLQYPLQQLWFGLMSATPEVKASGIDYFNARIWGAPAVVVNFVLIGWFLGREMSGSVLLMTLVLVVGYVSMGGNKSVGAWGAGAKNVFRMSLRLSPSNCLIHA